jgi:hypothetical protein
MFLPHKHFSCQPGKKWGGGPKVQKIIQNRRARMCDFKIGGQNRRSCKMWGPKVQLSLIILIIIVIMVMMIIMEIILSGIYYKSKGNLK